MVSFANKYSKSIEGANIPTDIIDVDKLAKVMQDERRANNAAMIIEISPIIKKVNRDTNLGITSVKDPYNNIVYGIYAGLDQFKNIIWARISLENGITLNLDNINDAKRWVVIRMHPKIKGSPFCLDADEALYEVNDPTIEAEKTYQKVGKIEKLFTMLRKMNGVDIIDAMRYLGETVNDQTTYKVAKARISEMILSNTDYVYQKMTSKQKGIEAKILAAVEYGIVQELPQEGYIYNEVPLGISMNDVINYFETNKTVRNSILAEVGQKDVVSHNAQSDFESVDKQNEDNIF